ncbi:MAG TPA: hypothetical protein VHI97_05070 [Actinomycetota bacterium]|nr:hypothetical protein [Actinomycetota bacterium]
MEGTYRLFGGEPDLFESFVAAPGPAGWRYFGRVFARDSELELSTVDFVVDTEWRLVRYRERHAAGTAVVIIPGTDGMEVITQGDGDEKAVEIPGAEIVWSRSPCSLLVAERRARALGTNALRGVRIHVPDDPGTVFVSLNRPGHEQFKHPPGSQAEMIQVRVDDESIDAQLAEDRPLSADGWFALIT